MIDSPPSPSYNVIGAQAAFRIETGGVAMSEEKTPRHMPFKDFVPDEAVKHAKAAREEMRKSVESLFPPGFVEHRRAARKEMLLAVRSLIDAAIGKIEEREKKE